MTDANDFQALAFIIIILGRGVCVVAPVELEQHEVLAIKSPIAPPEHGKEAAKGWTERGVVQQNLRKAVAVAAAVVVKKDKCG